MERGEVIVYEHPNGKDYIARFDEKGWRVWPARAMVDAYGAWAQRTAT